MGKVSPDLWEIKEYYYTTTFGSRVADGVYETLLDGMELEELRGSHQVDCKHYLIVDAHYTWWVKGRSYLCCIVDMLHMGYVDEVLFGTEVLERMPALAKTWAAIIGGPDLCGPQCQNGISDEEPTSATVTLPLSSPGWNRSLETAIVTVSVGRGKRWGVEPASLRAGSPRRLRPAVVYNSEPSIAESRSALHAHACLPFARCAAVGVASRVATANGEDLCRMVAV